MYLTVCLILDVSKEELDGDNEDNVAAADDIAAQEAIVVQQFEKSQQFSSPLRVEPDGMCPVILHLEFCTLLHMQILAAVGIRHFSDRPHFLIGRFLQFLSDYLES